MEYFIEDCKGFFTDPKGTFKRMSTYESLLVPTLFMFIAGVLLALRRLLLAGEHLEVKASISPYDLGLKDANIAMAVLTPFMVVAFWYICAFILNEVVEKLGAMKGDFPEILMASGYLSYTIIAFVIITFIPFYIGEVKDIKFVNALNTILEVIFIVWFFFLITQLLESICEVPFSVAFCTLFITLLGFAIIYWGVVEMVIKDLILVKIFQGRYL